MDVVWLPSPILLIHLKPLTFHLHFHISTVSIWFGVDNKFFSGYIISKNLLFFTPSNQPVSLMLFSFISTNITTFMGFNMDWMRHISLVASSQRNISFSPQLIYLYISLYYIFIYDTVRATCLLLSFI